MIKSALQKQNFSEVRTKNKGQCVDAFISHAVYILYNNLKVNTK